MIMVIITQLCINTVLCLVAQLCLTLWYPMDCSPPGSSVHGDSPGKNTGVGCRAVLREFFPTQGSNPGLPHCRQILYHISHQGSSVFPLRLQYLFPPQHYTIASRLTPSTIMPIQRRSRIEVSKRSGISVWFVCWHIPCAQNTRLAHGRLWINRWEWSGTSLFVTPASQPSLLNSRLIHATNH